MSSSLPPDVPESLREDFQFGALVVSQGLCTREQVEECLVLLKELARQGGGPMPRLGGLLMQRGYIGQAVAGRTLAIEGKPSRTVDLGTGPSATPAPSGTVDLGNGPVRPSADAGAPPEVERALAENRNVIGKYVRVRLLGVGGMGEVWKAWDRVLKRWVALKFLKHDDPREEARFRIEAQAAAALNHPNICAIYEVGRNEGRPYIAMQYLEGQTLQTHRRGDRREMAGIFRNVALAVQRAHEAGVIHRDLKPANIMVTSNAEVFVMDFGLAKATNVDSSISVSGSVVGTPAYMSPEQAKGVKDVDGRADVYSLGATMYENFGGEPLFAGSGIYDILVRISEEEPKPLRKRIPGFDLELDTIITKCIEKDRTRRYASLADLAEDLRRWLDHEPILAHPPSLLYRLRKRLLKRKAIVRLSAIAALLMIALAAVAWRWRIAFSGERKAEESAADERRLREKYERDYVAARSFLDRAQESVNQIRLKLRDKEFDIKVLADEAAEHYRKALAACEKLPEAHLGLSRVAGLTGNRKESLRQIELAIAADPGFASAYLDRVRQRVHDYEEERRDPSGEIRDETARARELKALMQADLARYERLARENTAEKFYAQGIMAFHQGDLEKAIKLMDAYLAEAPADGAAHYTKGRSLYYLKRYSEADGAFSRALESNVRDLASRKYRAATRSRLKDYPAAIEDLNEVIDADPESAYALLERGDAWLAIGNRTVAEEDYIASLKKKETWQGRVRLGQLSLHKKDFETALNLFVIALPTSDSNASTALILRHMANAQLLQGNAQGALHNLNQALRKSPQDFQAAYERGLVREKLNDAPGAAEDFKTALKNAPQEWPPREDAEKRLAALPK